jgi:hypothetical protein
LSISFKPEEQKVDYPARVAAIKEIYENEGFEWKLDPDKDLESVKETAYERLAKERPDTAYYEVLKVMRLRNEMDNKEYMIWKLRKYVAGMDPVEIYYGMLPYPLQIDPVLDADGNVIDKRIRKRGMKYTQEWNSEFFDRLLKESRNPRTLEFYLAEASDIYETYWYGTPIMVKNYDLFKTKTYQELMDADQKAAVKNKYGR